MEDVTLPCWNKSSLPGWTLLYFLSAWFPRHPHPERTVALICLNWTVVTPCSHWRGNRSRSDHNDMNIFYAFFLMVTIKSVVLLSFLKADIRQPRTLTVSESPFLAGKLVFSPLANSKDSWHPAAAVCNSVVNDCAKDAEREYESENFFANCFGPHGILLNLLFWLKTRSTLQCRRSQR